MNVCLYFQMHQPFRLARYRVFDIGTGCDYFDPGLDRLVLERVAERCYRPALDLLDELVVRHDRRFRFAFGATSTLLAQLEVAAPDVIERLRALVASGCVEAVAETSHHSLAGLFDRDELVRQVERHAGDLERLLGARPSTFRDTEMLFTNDVARTVAELGYSAMLAEGSEALLGMRSPNRVYTAEAAPSVTVLLRNHRLSDDIGFRFSDPGWSEYPLSADRYAGWIASQAGETANVFLDFEALGEHHDSATGIFELVAALPDALQRRGVGFHLPRDAARLDAAGVVGSATPVSWADRERDESAWLGNRMQRSAAQRLYALLPAVRASEDAALLETWRRLATSDHLYYVSTKGLDDGAVHAHFSPFDSPYDAFIALMNVLTDFERRVAAATQPSQRAAA